MLTLAIVIRSIETGRIPPVSIIFGFLVIL